MNRTVILNEAATQHYRAWKHKQRVAFQRAFGLTDADLDEDERALIGKEEPSEEWMAAWNAAISLGNLSAWFDE